MLSKPFLSLPLFVSHTHIYSSVNLLCGQTTCLIHTKGWNHVWSFWGVCIFLLILFEVCTAVGKPQPSCCCSLYCLSFVLSFCCFSPKTAAQLVAYTWVSVIAWHQTPLIAFFSVTRGRKDSLLVFLLCFLFLFSCCEGTRDDQVRFLLCVSVYVCVWELIHSFKCHVVRIIGLHHSPLLSHVNHQVVLVCVCVRLYLCYLLWPG